MSVTVRDAPAGEVLYARNADSRLIPASNQKLFIAAAGEELTVDHEFVEGARPRYG